MQIPDLDAPESHNESLNHSELASIRKSGRFEEYCRREFIFQSQRYRPERCIHVISPTIAACLQILRRETRLGGGGDNLEQASLGLRFPEKRDNTGTFRCFRVGSPGV